MADTDDVKSAEKDGLVKDKESQQLELQISVNSTEPKADGKGEKKEDKKGGKEKDPPPISAKEKWSYNEKANVEKVEASDGQIYTFRKENKAPRIIYFSIKVKRFSDIDNVRESFRSRFHIYLNWMLTKKEFESYLSFQKESKTKKKKMRWEPKFKPRIDFVNNVAEHHFESVEYPPDGCYRIQYFTNWLTEDECGFDARNTPFCRQKLECDYTFSETMELRSFPFDCQDFTIVIRESSGTKKAILMPESRYTNQKRESKSSFFKLDPTFSVLDEWDFYSTMLEVADSSSGASRSKSVYHEITVRFKVKRRWTVYGWNIIFYFAIITFLALTCFALDSDDLGERLNLAVVILLTLVAFQHTVFAKLPNIPYLTFMHKYIIVSFIFVCLVILETSLFGQVQELVYGPEEEVSAIVVGGTTAAPEVDVSSIGVDIWAAWVFGIIWFGYHILFILASGWQRHKQEQKLLMDSDEMRDKYHEKYPQFLFSWKSLRDFAKAGSYEAWEEEETIRQLKERETEREERLKNQGKKQDPKAKCVMEFGGTVGEILTFASYAQKVEDEKVTFCGYIGGVFAKCCSACFICCCCGCCRDQETHELIKKKRSQAFEARADLKTA